MSAIHDHELEPEDPTDEFTEGDPISIEAHARAMGWKPRNEYTGDPRRWTDAETFVKVGMEELPVLRNRNNVLSGKVTRMGTEIETLRRTVQEQQLAVQESLRMARTANEAGYQRALRELKAKQRTAAGDGDLATFDDLAEQIEAMETERATVSAPAEAPPAPAPDPAAPPPAPAIDPAIMAFVQDPANRWYFNASKPYLKATMIQLHNAVIGEGAITDVGEQLEEARARLVEMFPNDFQTRRPAPAPEPEDEQELEEESPVPDRRPAAPAARRAPGVSPPSRAPIAPGGQRRRSPFDTIADPAERSQAKDAFERMRSMDPGLTETEYMQLYDDPHADALELRRKRKPA